MHRKQPAVTHLSRKSVSRRKKSERSDPNSGGDDGHGGIEGRYKLTIVRSSLCCGMDYAGQWPVRTGWTYQGCLSEEDQGGRAPPQRVRLSVVGVSDFSWRAIFGFRTSAFAPATSAPKHWYAANGGIAITALGHVRFASTHSGVRDGNGCQCEVPCSASVRRHLLGTSGGGCVRPAATRRGGNGCQVRR